MAYWYFFLDTNLIYKYVECLYVEKQTLKVFSYFILQLSTSAIHICNIVYCIAGKNI